MRLASISVLVLLLASAAVGQLNPGFVVRAGDPFPIAADVNRDGLDDLIQEKSIILNHGGTLSDVRTLGLAMWEKVVGAPDVNGDHIPDLLTRDQGMPATAFPIYRLYIGDAAGAYSHPIQISSNAAAPYIADVDGDGKDDFLLFEDYRPDTFRTIYTAVTVLLSRGDGTFERLDPFRIAPDSQIDLTNSRLLAGDLDHDGKVDVVIRCAQDLVVLHGLGGGKFAVEDHFMPINNGQYEFGVRAQKLADVDGDGNLDLVLDAYRRIRVLFGDGHGAFTRTTSAPIARLHGISLPPIYADDSLLDGASARTIAVGHFTRNDRNQIAAGTGEGDVVVFEVQNGALKEVARTLTEFWCPDIRAGKFRNSGGDDLYIMGTLIWGEEMPRPRLYGADSVGSGASTAAARLPLRGRVSRPLPVASNSFQMSIHGDCVGELAAGRITFARDGVFGTAQRDDVKIEALFDGPSIYLRITGPALENIWGGVITDSGGVYSGTMIVRSQSCGYDHLTITATPR